MLKWWQFLVLTISVWYHLMMVRILENLKWGLGRKLHVSWQCRVAAKFLQHKCNNWVLVVPLHVGSIMGSMLLGGRVAQSLFVKHNQKLRSNLNESLVFLFENIGEIIAFSSLSHLVITFFLRSFSISSSMTNWCGWEQLWWYVCTNSSVSSIDMLDTVCNISRSEVECFQSKRYYWDLAA